MRLIKFRGKRIDNGKWVYGGIITKGNYAAIVTYSDYHGWHDFVEVDPATVGQFVGLRDMDWRQIYEESLLESDQDDLAGKIEWSEDEASYRLVAVRPRRVKYFVNAHPRLKHFKVIGNIHDDPGLLLEVRK